MSGMAFSGEKAAGGVGALRKERSTEGEKQDTCHGVSRVYRALRGKEPASGK